MPWTVTGKAKGCNGFAVVKEGTNTPIPGGCHKTRKEAIKHLIALELSYDERGVDQPRDNLGRFASKGGGGATAADQSGAGVGSKMKSAPKNVTSKGVNPDVEYVQSMKTGNVFKNPSYNGNPNGKGKVAPNGKYKDNVSDFSKLPGGDKFLATGQAKHKVGVSTAKKKGKPKIADEAPEGGIAGSYKDVVGLDKTPTPKIVEAPPPSKADQKFFSDNIDRQVAAQSDMNQGILHRDINGGSNNDQLNKLNSSQKSAIVKYTGNDFDDMNFQLRKDKGLTKNKKIIDAEAGLNKGVLQKDVVLHRRINGRGLQKLEPGDEIYDPGFISTSTKKRFGGDVQLRIQGEAYKTKGMSVRQISLHREEDEVLLPPGLTLRIISKKTLPKNDWGSDTGLVVFDAEIVKQGIRPGVSPTKIFNKSKMVLEQRKARSTEEEDKYFSSPEDSLAINGVFPDGFTLTG